MFSEYEAIKEICELSKDIVITSVGNISKIVYDIEGENKNVFYMLGSMGLSISFGLGIAMSDSSKRVVAFVGDGAGLMNLGAFALVGSQECKITIIVIDNGIYNTTGSQESLSGNIKWKECIESLGVSSVFYCFDADEVKNAWKKVEEQEAGPSVIIIKTMPIKEKIKRVQISPRTIMDKFKEKLEV